MRYRPTEVVSADELESIHDASLRILEEIGMDFLDEGARDLLVAAGARVESGTQRVRFDRDMVLERIKTAPSSFTLHATNPDHHLQIGGDWMAFGSVASAPNVADLDHAMLRGHAHEGCHALGHARCTVNHAHEVRIGRGRALVEPGLEVFEAREWSIG